MSLYDRIAFPLQAPNPALQRPGQSSSSSSSFATEDKIRTLVDEYGQRDDLDEDEKMWLSRECIARFLQATKGNLPETRTRLKNCLSFRRSWNLYNPPANAVDVAPESPCGKEFLYGYSSKGQPVLYFYPNRSDTEVGERQMRHTVYMLERTIDLMPPGISNLCLIIDLAGKSRAPTSVAQAKLFVEILGNHYPERLGSAVILNLPWMVKKFLDLIFKFVDPVTKAKVSWESSFVKDGLVPKPTALKDHGGDVPFVYNHDEYWPTLLQVAMDKRTRQKATWKALGGTVGISEYDYKTIGATSTGAPSGSSSSSAPAQGQQQPQLHIQTQLPTQTHARIGTSVSSAASSDGATLHDSHGLNDPDVHDGHLKQVVHAEPGVLVDGVTQRAG